MRYLLDTNMVSELVRNPQGQVAKRIREVGEQQVCTRIIVAAELRYEAEKKGSARLTAQLEAVLSPLEVIPYEVPADATYGRLRSRLERAGQPIGANDLLIAAHALTLGCTIVTDNDREFRRIDELPWEIGCGNNQVAADRAARKRPVVSAMGPHGFRFRQPY